MSFKIETCTCELAQTHAHTYHTEIDFISSLTVNNTNTNTQLEINFIENRIPQSLKEFFKNPPQWLLKAAKDIY